MNKLTPVSELKSKTGEYKVVLKHGFRTSRFEITKQGYYDQTASIIETIIDWEFCSQESWEDFTRSRFAKYADR